MVYFGNFDPFDDAMEEMRAHWWQNDEWNPLITWWEIRGHKWGPIDDAMMNWVMGN